MTFSDQRLRVGSFLLFLVLWLSACSADERQSAFEAVANEGPASFAADLPAAYAEEIRALPGIARRDRNFFPRILVGDDVLVFDWVWQDDRLKDRNRAAQTVFAFREPGAGFPAFSFGQVEGFDRAELRDLGGPVEFTAPAVWRERYVVAGAAKGAIRKRFPKDLRGAYALPHGLRIEARGHWIVAYRPDRLANPRTVTEELLDVRAALAPWLSAP